MTSSLSWISNDGTTWTFDGSEGVTTVDEDEGIFTIPTDLIIDQRVGDGGVLVNERRAPRRVVLSFMLDADSGSVLSLWRTFFASLAAGGVLQYEGPTDTLQLRSVVLEGPGRSMSGHDLQYRGVDVYPVSLLALDPWWLSVLYQASLNVAASTGFDAAIDFDASVPFDGGATRLVQNLGSATMYPVIEATGPFDTLSVTVGPGAGWSIATPIASGEKLIVRHTPDGSAYVSSTGQVGPFLLSNAGRIDWSLLDPAAVLFGLDPGITTVGVSATGTDGDSAARILYHERFLTP